MLKLINNELSNEEWLNSFVIFSFACFRTKT